MTDATKARIASTAVVVIGLAAIAPPARVRLRRREWGDPLPID